METSAADISWLEYSDADGLAAITARQVASHETEHLIAIATLKDRGRGPATIVDELGTGHHASSEPEASLTSKRTERIFTARDEATGHATAA
jgi:hypothetical protein